MLSLCKKPRCHCGLRSSIGVLKSFTNNLDAEYMLELYHYQRGLQDIHRKPSSERKQHQDRGGNLFSRFRTRFGRFAKEWFRKNAVKFTSINAKSRRQQLGLSNSCLKSLNPVINERSTHYKKRFLGWWISWPKIPYISSQWLTVVWGNVCFPWNQFSPSSKWSESLAFITSTLFSHH